MDLTTLANVARLLEQDVATMDAETQALIAAMITTVSARAASYCGRQFERVERDCLCNGGGQFLVVPEIPVQSVRQVLYSFSWEWDSATVYGDSDYALINPAAGIIGFKWAGCWPDGAKALKVTYTGGYDPAPAGDEEPAEDYVPIPADLEGAICRQVAYEWRRRNDPGISSVSLPDGTINKMQVDEWLKDVEATLRRYRVRPG